MDKIILWVAALAVLGWVVFYLFGRQLFFNFKTAYPLYKKMKAESDDLIDDNANRYTNVSVGTTIAVMVILAVVVILLFRKRIYAIIAYFAGLLICALMLIGKNGPEIRKNFDAFCGAYYRFIHDDELRTAMYNLKPSQMKVRLHDMDLSTMWIPDFKG